MKGVRLVVSATAMVARSAVSSGYKSEGQYQTETGLCFRGQRQFPWIPNLDIRIRGRFRDGIPVAREPLKRYSDISLR